MATGTQIGFRIASLGVAGTDRLVHFMSGAAPSWDSDAAWVTALPHDRFPGQLASEVNFRDGSSTVGGMGFEVTASAALSNGKTVAQMLYDLTPVAVAQLDAGFLYSATTVNTDDATLAGQEVFVAQTGEVIRLGTHTGSGSYTGCTRALWGTRAQTVAAGTSEYGTPALYDPTTGPVLAWRRIEMVRVHMDTATGYSDVEVLWTGVIRPDGIARPQPGLITLEADSLLGMLEGRKIRVSPWTGDVLTLIDPDNQTQAVFGPDPALQIYGLWEAVGERGVAPGATPSLLSVEGKAAVSVTLTQTGADPRYRGRWTSLDLYLAGNQQTAPRHPPKPARAWECDHHSGTSAGALPYHQNLLTSFLQCLTTTREGNNGSYDVGTDTAGDEDYGLGVDASLVDVSGIEKVRDRLGDLLVQPLNFFNFDKPDGADVLKWYGERLWPYGVVITQRGSALGVALLDDHPDFTTATLTESSDILGPSSEPPRAAPSHVRREDLVFVRMRAEYSAYPGLEPISDTFVDANRQNTHRFSDQDAPRGILWGVDDALRVSEVVVALIQRFHDPLGEATFSTLRTSGAAFDAGDLIDVTHASMPSSQLGARGVTSTAFLVTSKEDDLSTGTTTVRALDVGSLYQNAGRIAPALVVDSYTSGATVTFEQNLAGGGFQSGLLADYPEDQSDIQAGWVMDHCDEHGVVREAGLVVGSVSSPDVTFTTTPSTAPIAGDIFRVSDYDSANSEQQTRYAHLADSNGQLGSGNAAGDQYTAY